MSGPQWYPRVMRRCETCEGEGQVAKNFGIDSWPAVPEIVACPDCSGGYVDVDATEECPCAEKGYGRWDSSDPETDCADCGGSGRVPSLAALVLPGDEVLIQNEVDSTNDYEAPERWLSLGTVAAVIEGGVVVDEGDVGEVEHRAPLKYLARVVTVDEVERRGRFAWNGEK